MADLSKHAILPLLTVDRESDYGAAMVRYILNTVVPALYDEIDQLRAAAATNAEIHETICRLAGEENQRLRAERDRLAATIARVEALIHPDQVMAAWPYGVGGGRYFDEGNIRAALDGEDTVTALSSAKGPTACDHHRGMTADAVFVTACEHGHETMEALCSWCVRGRTHMDGSWEQACDGCAHRCRHTERRR